jgi:pimeloyl-ACP methyl ester carboxylesterase
MASDARRLHHETRGEGEPLLLIQGLSGTHLSWGEPFLSALGDGLSVTAYDHRGIGRSSPLDGSFTIADLAGDAIGLLDELGLESAHVMGISMGGMVAQEVALAAPERVRSLTLGCTYAGGEGSRLTDQGVSQRLITAAMSGDRELVLRTGWELNVSPEFAAEPGNFEAFKAMAGQVPVAVTVLFEQLQAVLGHDTSTRLSSISAPTLVVHGDGDQILNVANAHHIAGLIPGARLEILEGAGHMFWWERPEETARLVREHVLAAAAV